MSQYRAPSRTKYKCTVGWLRGKFEDGYFYGVWDGNTCISGGGMGNRPYRYRDDGSEETNLPTIADLMMDSWGHIDWATPEGANLVRTLIDDAWQESLPDENGPPLHIKRIISEALYGATQKRSAAG